MKKQGKRRSGLLILVLALALSMLQTTSAQAASAAYRNGPDIYGEAYCVMDADTGEIICAKNAMGLYHPASITKIMTALVTIEQVKDLNETLTYSENAVNGISVHSSTCQPKAMVGEKMTVWDTLNGMMLVSGNECAMALAEHVGGTVENFMDMVNKRVKELGATNTHFTNPHGIDNVEHYTNPYDMALLFRAALQNDTFRKLVSSVTYTIPVTNLCSTPRVLTMGHQIVAGNIEFDGVYAGKTGRTAWAGRTLLTAAEHNGRNFVVALMKSGEDYFYTDTEILLEYAYAVADGQEPWGWQECNETYIANSNVNLRDRASQYGTVRGSLLQGQEVTCTGTYAGWCRVVIDNRTYYVDASFVHPKNVPETVPETELESETETIAETLESTEAESSSVANETETPEAEQAKGWQPDLMTILLGIIGVSAVVGIGVVVWYVVSKWREK